MEEALDHIVKNFPGLWIYENSPHTLINVAPYTSGFTNSES